MSRLPQTDELDRVLTTVTARPWRWAKGHGLLLSFRYAGAGLAYLFRTQRNARIHLAAALLVTALGLWLGLDGPQLAVLWLTMTVVLVTEAFNTALEATVDLVTDRYHPLAKIAKDTAAGAVLLAAIGAVGVGIALLLPPLLQRAGL